MSVSEKKRQCCEQPAVAQTFIAPDCDSFFASFFRKYGAEIDLQQEQV